MRTLEMDEIEMVSGGNPVIVMAIWVAGRWAARITAAAIGGALGVGSANLVMGEEENS